MKYRFASLLLLFCLSLLTACGGGGGGGSTSAAPVEEPAPSSPEPEPTPIAITDAVPGDGTTGADPVQPDFYFAHPAQSDLSITFDSNCSDSRALTQKRSLVDLASADFDELVTHYVSCNLAENTTYSIAANGTRSNDAGYVANLEFSTGTSAAPGITVLDQISLARSTVNDLFRDYVEGGLVTELDLPASIQSLVIDLVIDLSEANWDNLTDPQSLYPVTSQSVTYLSRTPDGSPSTELTGLISFPVVELSPKFVARDRVLVLTHATGSTPGDLATGDAWYILANLFASRGYLVVAPDNYGRGGTSENPETYLMANRTAQNAYHMLQQVLADTAYEDIYSGTDASIVGYSQGGHSAIALWQLITLQDDPEVTVHEVYAGGAPYNLYQTVRGVMQHIDSSCDDEAYCRYVDTETTVPFATDRILPGLMSYTKTGLQLEDVVIGDTLDSDFVRGFLANEAAYDGLKTLLQLNSFTRVSNAEIFAGASTRVHLYHSQYDRLVSINNTEELADTLSAHVSVDHHENRCNSNGYELIFNLTDKVGALHTLCGLSVLDDAMGDLR